jgi:hypothetical protein
MQHISSPLEPTKFGFILQRNKEVDDHEVPEKKRELFKTVT